MNIITLLSQVPGVDYAMLDAEFWLDRMDDPDQIIITNERIPIFNREVHTRLGIPSIFDLPDTLTAGKIQEVLPSIPQKTRYNSAGDSLEQAYYHPLVKAFEIPVQAEVRFGLMIRRASLRTFPTADIATSKKYDFPTDMFQETTVDVGWPVAVVAEDYSSHWLFCLTPLYWGWVQSDTVALFSREIVQPYVESPNWMRTLSSRGLVGLVHGGGVTPQMGTRLPLVGETEQFYRTQVPVSGGELVEGFISKEVTPVSQFQKGDLLPTPRTILTAAFSLLGERYAWGGGRMGIFGRDCSRVIKDIYATTGVILPRNGSKQKAVCSPLVTFSEDMSAGERKTLIIEKAAPGDILFMPGHDMLYLGHVDGEPYVLHAKGGRHKCVLVSTLHINDDEPGDGILNRLTSVGGVR